MGTLTTNYQFQKPAIGGDRDSWADAYDTGDPATDPSPGLVGNWQKMDLLHKELEDKILGLENSLPANTYYEAGDDYRIIGETLECWGRVVSIAGDLTENYPKRFLHAPSLSFTITSTIGEDRTAARQSQTITNAKLELEVAARANGGYGDWSGVPIFWYAIGQWDGVS